MNSIFFMSLTCLDSKFSNGTKLPSFMSSSQHFMLQVESLQPKHKPHMSLQICFCCTHCNVFGHFWHWNATNLCWNDTAWKMRTYMTSVLEYQFWIYKIRIPYARHYKPRLIFFFTQFSLQLRLILQTIYVVKTEILHFLSLKSAANKRERLQIESGLWWRAYSI